MLPTNMMSFMKKMVSNTETVPPQPTGQFMTVASQGSAAGGSGAIGRLRQTLQQAQESVSSRLTSKPQTPQFQVETPTETQPLPTTIVVEAEKENAESPRPGSAGRCRVCVKAMKPDEYFRECTECSLKVCDDCASYSSHAEGNETNWRCSVCRRRGVAIIARRVKPGIEASEALEGVGFETKIRKSADSRRLGSLQAGGRADSETEVLLLAPKASDVRRHSDVPLRDIAKFQAGAGISAATSQHDLGLTVSMSTEKSKSSSDIGTKVDDSIVVVTKESVQLPNGKGVGVKKPAGKVAAVKRQRSYERGASEGTLNLPGNPRGRRASCDLRGTGLPLDSSSLLNNNTIQSSTDNKSGDRSPLEQHKNQRIERSSEDKAQQPHHHPQQHHPPQQHQHHPQQQHHQQQGPPHEHERRKSTVNSMQGAPPDANERRKSTVNSMQGAPPDANERRKSTVNSMQGAPPDANERRKSTVNSMQGAPPDANLVIRNDTRRRSVQIYNTTSKPPATPRSCNSLDTENPDVKHDGSVDPVIKRQGSSTDGESIKIVIDDVDSTTAKTKTDNNKNKGRSNNQDLAESRTRMVRLRRDVQDRGYQTRGFGIRVVGGCSSAANPGLLRARVARVSPGSGADFAGIRRGDIILVWNGIKLTNLTFEEVCKIIYTSPDTVEITIAPLDNDQITVSTVPENEPAEWEDGGTNESETMGVNSGGDYSGTSPSRMGQDRMSMTRQLPRLPSEGRIQLRLFHDEVHNTLEIGVVNIAFGNDDCTTIDLNDICITLRIGEKVATTRWNQCTLFTKVSPEDLFDSWLILELTRGQDFLGESHVDMGRVSLDDRPVWFPFSAKGSSTHRGSIQLVMTSGGNTPPSARELARRLRMRRIASNAGSQSQSEDQDDSSGQSSPCASLLRPEVAWEVLGTLGPPSANLTSRSAPTSRRGSAQSDRMAIGIDGMPDDGRGGSGPSTPQMPRSLPPSRRGSFAVAVEEVISRSRRSSVAYQQPRIPDGRLLPELPDGPDPSMFRNRRASAWNPGEVRYDNNRRQQFERTDSLRAIPAQPIPRRTSNAESFREFALEAHRRLRQGPESEQDNWQRQQAQQQQQWRQE